MAFVLTSGALAVAFGLATFVGVLKQFQIPLAIGFLVVLAWAQWRAGRRQERELNSLTAAIYQYHPTLDEGLDFDELGRADEVANPAYGPSAWRGRIILQGSGKGLRLVLGMPADHLPFLTYALPKELHRPSPFLMGAPIATATVPPKSRTPTIFEFTLPADLRLSEVALFIHGNPPPPIVSIEWIR
jgi:hypothetical protein